MTERGLPLADGAPACPFVAFDDDRDERSSVPDHRHRCFAETTPAPRALAHQEAYCLSSAFPVCPTFQDWARREAAHSRGGAAVTPPGAAASPAERAGVPPPVVAPGLAQAAAGAAASHQADPDSRDDLGPDDGPAISDGAAAAAAAATLGGAAGATTPGEEDDDPWERPSARPDGSAQRNPHRDWAAPPPWLASDEAKRRRAEADAEPPSFLGRRTEPSQGLAGSPADRMAGGTSIPPEPEREEEWTSAARPAPRPRPATPPEDLEAEDLEEEPPRRSTRRPRAYAQHLGGPDGPDWERPRRYEAYPTIRSRVGLPRVRVPSIALMAIAVLIAALALFFLPGILHLGGGGSGGPTPKPSASPRPSVSLAPTLPPEPTPVLYTIKKGDTLSKIAAAHGVSVDELLAANPTIKDPNRITLGQQIVIPTPGASLPDTVGGSASPS